MKTTYLDPIVDSFKRARRRNLSITIDREARVNVVSPYHLQISEINDFVRSKIDWIEKSKIRVIANKPLIRNYEDGEEFLYLGVPRKLKYVSNVNHAIAYLNDEFHISTNVKPYAKEYLAKLYKNLAWNYFVPKTYEFAKKYNFKFSTTKISSANSKWGSCSSRGSINLSWRLVMAPEPVIDYVIIHELAHTVEANHSAKFWAIVEKIIPDYKSKRKWLKDNGKYCDV
jgi:predicted metal-dependent hydrolase